MSGHRGVKLLERYRAGGHLTRGQSMLAKCAECCACYADGRQDCGLSACPMYPYRPYKRGDETEEPEEPEATSETVETEVES